MSSAPKIVTVSDGQKVTFKPCFTHKAERAFNEEMSRDVMFERGDDGRLVAKKVPELNFDRAAEAALLVMIHSIEKGAETLECTRDWLDNLPERDYKKLTTVLAEIKNEADTKIEEGKKKD